MTIEPKQISGAIKIGDKLAGTAWRVRPDLALTARHCLRKSAFGEDLHAACAIEFADGSLVTGTLWHEDKDLDVATLTLTPAGGDFMQLAALPWTDAAVAGESKLLWHAYGYPDAHPEGLELNGKITSVSDRAGRGLQLSCEQGGYKNLKHASGSGIVYGNRVVALLVWHPEALAGSVLFAQPLDKIAKHTKFSYLRAPLHYRFRPGGSASKLHLECDRVPQWRRFEGCVDQRAAVEVLIVEGHEDEAPDVFVERIEHMATDFRVVSVRWPFGVPYAQVDFVSALSQALVGEELARPDLLSVIHEMCGEIKLVIRHPLLDVSSPMVRARLEDVSKYYGTTLPELFSMKPLSSRARGLVIVQPVYWKSRGLARLFALKRKPRRWQAWGPIGDPALPVVVAPEMERILPPEVLEFLENELRRLPPERRHVLQAEVLRCRTSREIFKFLKENIG